MIEAVLERDAAIEPDALYPQLRCRTTQRRMLDSEPLSTSARTALEASVGSGYRVIWVEGGRDKWRMARLLFENAHIRLTIPEAYRVHRAIIHWNARYSRDRIPDQALGIADPLTLRLMRWAMQSWSRVQFLNRYFGGTLMPRLQLDLLPALRCAAHFVLVAERQPVTIDDYMEGGRRLQRFWLTATRLGLLLQPEMTPLIFARYVREGIRFSTLDRAQAEAIKLSDRLEALIGRQACTRALFMGRLGRGTQPQSRSLRRPLEQLLVHGEEDPRRPAG
ncbi:MAG TPA: molybdopterin biosynthesis protein MoeY [Sedimenticola sp.]|nr:molybdopterin biosynthesis protein MoeY [Sedimenticola sp.]